jgi:hypothetical protein
VRGPHASQLTVPHIPSSAFSLSICLYEIGARQDFAQAGVTEIVVSESELNQHSTNRVTKMARNFCESNNAGIPGILKLSHSIRSQITTKDIILSTENYAELFGLGSFSFHYFNQNYRFATEVFSQV